MNKAAILVAGGKGLRIGGPVAKQYLPIAGKPVLMHTLAVFFKIDPQIHLILVLPASDFEFWKSLCNASQFTIPHKLVAGGNTRFQSVRNGLEALPFSSGLVAIHDGVRPFVKPEVIENSFDQAENSGSAACICSADTPIRKPRMKRRKVIILMKKCNQEVVQRPQPGRSGDIARRLLCPSPPVTLCIAHQTTQSSHFYDLALS